VTPAMYSERSRFESMSGGRLSFLVFYVVFARLSRKVLGFHLKTGNKHFLLDSQSYNS
jgi:hypothetical protein